MRSRLAVGALLLALPLLPAAPAQADESLRITSVAVEDVPPATDSPHLVNRQAFAVSFDDATPSDPLAYRIDVEWHGSWDGVVADRGDQGGLVAVLPTQDFLDGEQVSFTVVEVREDGTSTSAPFPVTVDAVDHPQLLMTNAQKRHGVFSYDVGQPAVISFGNGTWEKGTRFDTRVFVSDKPHFTTHDLEQNLAGRALVEAYDTAAPVREVTIPRRLVGTYLWVSVTGRKDGEVGWGFTERAARVVVVKERWRLKRLTHRRDSVCTAEHLEAMRLVGGGGRYVFMQEKWGRRPWRKAARQTTLSHGRFDFATYGTRARRYHPKFWNVIPAHHTGQFRWNQRLVVPADETHKRLVGPLCTVWLN